MLKRTKLLAVVFLVGLGCGTGAPDGSTKIKGEVVGSASAFAPDPTPLWRTGSGWQFRQSAISGGGQVMAVLADPTRTGVVWTAGDTWGLYNSDTAGNLWLPALKAGGTPSSFITGTRGTSFFSGLAMGHSANTVYGLLGKDADTPTEVSTTGGFMVVKGDGIAFVKLTTDPGDSSMPSGFESQWDRTLTPRPNHRLVVDYQAAEATEFIYAGAGNGNGVFRSTDVGRSWDRIALAGLDPGEFISGMAMSPADASGNTLVVATRTRAHRTGTPIAQMPTGKVYVVSGVKGVPSAVRVSVHAVPEGLTDVERIGGKLWATAGYHGVFRSADGATWTPVSPGVFAPSDYVSAIAGVGQHIVVGVAGESQTQHFVYRSLTGGDSWDTPVDDGMTLDTREWGTDQNWWHADSKQALLSGNSFVADSASMDVNGRTVYIGGRAGVWKSEDAGATWRPAVAGLAGTMHTAWSYDAAHDLLMTDDADWNCIQSRPADAFLTSASLIHIQAGCPLLQNPTTTSLRATGTAWGTLEVIPPGPSGPAKFLVDGKDEANEWFRAQVIRPSALIARGGFVFIAQNGGGVIVAKRN